MTAKSVFVYGRYTKPPGRLPEAGAVRSVQGKRLRRVRVGFQRGRQRRRGPGEEARQGPPVHKGEVHLAWERGPGEHVFPPGRPFMAEVKDPRRREVPSRFVARTGKGTMKVSGLKVLKGKPSSVPSFIFKTRAFIQPEGRIETIPRGLNKALTAGPDSVQEQQGQDGLQEGLLGAESRRRASSSWPRSSSTAVCRSSGSSAEGPFRSPSPNSSRHP